MKEGVELRLPLDLLDSIWPAGFHLATWKQRALEVWIDSLVLYAEMGLLTMTGNGTERFPYRWTANNPAAFGKFEPDPDECTTLIRGLLARGRS